MEKGYDETTVKSALVNWFRRTGQKLKKEQVQTLFNFNIISIYM